MGVLFKHLSIGWLSKYVGTFIQKLKYVYSLPQQLSRYRNSNLHRHGKKNVCGKFLFFRVVFLICPDSSLDLSLIIHEVVKENVISEKQLKKRNFPHTIFLPYLWRFKSIYVDKRWGKLLIYFDFFMGYLCISLVSQYWTCLNRTPIEWRFSKSAFYWLSSLKIW
jgi:hypothetical protein